jgi:hypothetical protein
MKRILLNSGFCVCLVTAMVSVWIAANPASVLAASSSATCRDGREVNCESVGAGSCAGYDANGPTNGFCVCTENGVQTDHHSCDDPPEVN